MSENEGKVTSARNKLARLTSQISEIKNAQKVTLIETKSIFEEQTKDMMTMLYSVFQNRRSQLDSNDGIKKSLHSTLSSYSDSRKKLLWDKREQWRVTIILRPSRSSILNEIKKTIVNISESNPRKSEISLEEENIRAEKMLLLSLHPQSPINLSPSVPPSTISTSKIWAEPGWQLVLNPEGHTQRSSILQSNCGGQLLRRLSAEYSSAPGHQAASFVRPSHLRNLMNPLSKRLQANGKDERYVNVYVTGICSFISIHYEPSQLIIRPGL